MSANVLLNPLASLNLAPVQVGELDHYTLIVEDAKAVARFHCDVLGFKHLRIQELNAGSAPEGENDMLNHVLQAPLDGPIVVITEGLTDDSIFCRYMRSYGPGLHHVAYHVEDLDAAVERLRNMGVETTSSEVLRDPLTGLRQIFIRKQHAGYFIELIERTEEAPYGNFTDDNMARLAQTMTSYLNSPEVRSPEEIPAPEVEIDVPRSAILEFLLDPFNLPIWTAHKTIRRINGRIVEVRMVGDVGLEVYEDEKLPHVHFVWSRAGGEFKVSFAVEPVPGKPMATRVRAVLPDLPLDRALTTIPVIKAELGLLAGLFGAQPSKISDQQRKIIDEYHLEVYQRPGL